MKPEGVIIRPVNDSVKATLDKIEVFLKAHGATIYARINQQHELNENGLSINPLEFLLFGNLRAGGPVMQHNPIAALDLPLKIIAWEDADGKVWLAFNDPSYIEARYGLPTEIIGPLVLEPLIGKALE